MIFYGHHESGHAFKVAMALALSDLKHEFRWVDLGIPASERPPDVREACKFGEVPALVDEFGTFVQSNAILLHLAETHRCLGGEAEPLRAITREWLFWEANRVGFSLANLRHLVYFERRPESEVGTWLRERLSLDLAILNARLTASAFLLGDRLTVADLSCSAYLFFAPEAGVDLTPWPLLQAWLERIRSLPGWLNPLALMPPPNPPTRPTSSV